MLQFRRKSGNLNGSIQKVASVYIGLTVISQHNYPVILKIRQVKIMDFFWHEGNPVM